MTEEEVKLFFDKVRRCQNLYNSIIYERDHIEEDLAAAKAIDYSKPHVSGGGTSDLLDVVLRIQAERDRCVRELTMRLWELECYKQDAIRLLRTLKDPELESVMIDRYLCGMSWKNIFRTHHIERSEGFRRHQKAIRLIAESLTPGSSEKTGD
jgi:hypothetical protein